MFVYSNFILSYFIIYIYIIIIILIKNQKVISTSFLKYHMRKNFNFERQEKLKFFFEKNLFIYAR